MTLGEQKFDTCKWRSDVEAIYFQKYCCGQETKWGYLCNKLDIGGINPMYCEGCQAFEAKPKDPILPD